MRFGNFGLLRQPRRPITAVAKITAAVALVCAAGSARAALVVAVANSTARAGGTGSFDVVLADTGGTYNVAGFSFELGVLSTSGVKFTAATTTTTAEPYLYGTDQQPPFSFNSFPTTDFTASDGDFTAPYTVTLNTGTVYGLGRVTYSTATTTTLGNVPVVLESIGNATVLSDLNGNPVAFTPVNGTINVTPVPEPATLGTVAVAFPLLRRSMRRRR